MTDAYDASGILVVDKPPGMTSHAVVAQARKAVGVKIGHTGTLDPLATGVLPLALGQATRLAQFFQGHDKAYRAVVRLGRTTDTYDREGRVLEEKSVPELSSQRVSEILSHFRGRIQQRIPAYSAVKIKGRKLYEYARRGESVAPPTRETLVHSLRLVQRDPHRWTLEVECSSGTYIRSLAHDIGVSIGCGAHLEDLRRTSAGGLTLEGALKLDEVGLRWAESLRPLHELLPELQALSLGDEQAERIAHGNAVQSEDVPADQRVRLLAGGKLIAIALTSGDGWIQPKIVFTP